MVDTTSSAQVAEYLSKNYAVSEEDAKKLCAQPEAAAIIESAVSCRSFVFYPADRIADAFGLLELDEIDEVDVGGPSYTVVKPAEVD